MSPTLLVIFGIGSLLLRAGFALQASGSLRAKSSAAAVLRITAESAAATLAFWAFGAGILFQTHNGWIGFDRGFLFREPMDFASTEFFHLTLCMIGGAIVTTITATALWCHMDAVLQTKASVGQLQGAFVQLQKDNPQLKVTIPGIRQDADYNDGGTLTGGTTNFLFARRQTPL